MASRQETRYVPEHLQTHLSGLGPNSNYYDSGLSLGLYIQYLFKHSHVIRGPCM